MRNRWVWILGLTLLMTLLCGCAAAETTYQELCRTQGLNSQEVVAWLEIPGASISKPVMCHPEDDAYYTRRDPKGEENGFGSLYIQDAYNDSRFTDPVTLIYGSSAAEKSPFAKLQQIYSGSFDECRTIYLHLPEETREYLVFAAIPHSSTHILHYYDFHSAGRYQTFFDNVFSTRALAMHLDQNNRPEPGKDQVLILSTHLRGDSLQRYLVMAILVTK